MKKSRVKILLASSFLLAMIFRGLIAQDVIFSEIHYNPTPLSADEEAAGMTDISDFEFIEIYNAEESPVNISGWRLHSAVEYIFPDGSIIGANSYMVIAKDEDVLPSRHQGLEVAGDYKGKLANEGERLVLYNEENQIVDQVTYSFESPWPKFANGNGGSLVRKEWLSGNSGASAWCASRTIEGTPGNPAQLDPGPVIINEILAHTDLPLEDAIELMNLTEEDISLGDWFLSDSITEPKKYRIPNGFSVSPKDFIVFYQQQFGEPFNPLVPFSFNSAKGDAVYLFQTDAQGKIIRLADSLVFPPTENGVSFGRYPDGASDLVNLELPTFGAGVTANDSPLAIHLFRKGKGAPNSRPLIGPVIVNSFEPSPSADEQQFVELKNISDDWVLLQDPLHPNNTWGIDGDIQFALPRGILLASNESIFIVEKSIETFREKNKFNEDTMIYGPWSGVLGNRRSSFRLYKPDPPQTRPPDIGLVPRILVDKVEFDLDSDWDFDVIENDYFLKRISPYSPSHLPESWGRNSGLNPTPGHPQLEVKFLPPDNIEISYSVTTSDPHTLEVSSNLSSWSQSLTIEGPISGVFTISLDANENQYEFFRIRRVAPNF